MTVRLYANCASCVLRKVGRCFFKLVTGSQPWEVSVALAQGRLCKLAHPSRNSGRAGGYCFFGFKFPKFFYLFVLDLSYSSLASFVHIKTKTSLYFTVLLSNISRDKYFFNFCDCLCWPEGKLFAL